MNRPALLFLLLTGVMLAIQIPRIRIAAEAAPVALSDEGPILIAEFDDTQQLVCGEGGSGGPKVATLIGAVLPVLRFQVVTGQIPKGTQLDGLAAQDGFVYLVGIPEEFGDFCFTFMATDSAGNTGTSPEIRVTVAQGACAAPPQDECRVIVERSQIAPDPILVAIDLRHNPLAVAVLIKNGRLSRTDVFIAGIRKADHRPLLGFPEFEDREGDSISTLSKRAFELDVEGSCCNSIKVDSTIGKGIVLHASTGLPNGRLSYDVEFGGEAEMVALSKCGPGG
jgi:hypothetical protein